MSDYVSEAEALSDIYDCGTDDFIDEDGDYNLLTRDDAWLYSCVPVKAKPIKSKNKKHVKEMHATRCEKLSDDIESVRETNKAAKTGTTCACPMCKKEFGKSSYQQTFCSSKCRLKYNNSRFWY